ncbi:MAG TPA: DUF6526 family protein [Dongiaceae bacterium]|nr:DUF6526 family protein [Dongiaceae bacterium]
MSGQSYSNHTKWVPAFHFFLLPVLLLNLGQSIYWLVRWRNSGALGLLQLVFHLLMALALITTAFLARTFALTVQDRVIRLEEQLRYQRLLPADLQARMGEFTVAQFVSLRFASDAELPGLARKVLDEKIRDRKAIKLLIRDWRADNLRA